MTGPLVRMTPMESASGDGYQVASRVPFEMWFYL